jgi:hypothetical protein
MNTTTPTTAGNPVGSSAQEDDSLSEQMKQVRAAALLLLDKAESATSAADMAVAVEKAAAALKLAAEMGKVRADLAKVNEEISTLKRDNESAPKRERSERLRDYVALLTPLVTIITLAATLIAQNWQFLRSERNKQEDALDAKWQDAVKAISASGALSPGVVALQPFLRSQKYGEQAREMAVNLLSNSSDTVFFTSLFGTALAPVNLSNVDTVVRLDRALCARQGPLLAKSWDADKQTIDTTRLIKDELASYNYIEAVIPTITSQIGSVLKTPRPPRTQVDLSATCFKNGDWEGTNLDGVNLEGTRLIWTSLRNAELGSATQFTSANLYRTAWWEVKSINKSMLDYLRASSPFTPGIPYGPRDEISHQADYDAAIARLTSQPK